MAALTTNLKYLSNGLGIEARFAKDDHADSIESLINEKTKAIYTETIGNPGFQYS